jgi:uncharacterized membrane protein
MNFGDWVELVGKGVDAAGIAIIVIGAIIATVDFILQVQRQNPMREVYRRYRMGLGRAILLGLELLVAADIIRTVAVQPTFEDVGVLAAIVLIRTFLSTALELELEGRWPWQHQDVAGASEPASNDSPT